MGSEQPSSKTSRNWLQNIFPTGPTTFGSPSPEYEQIELFDPQQSQFDKAVGTRKACIVGLAVSFLIGVAFLIVGMIAEGSLTVFDLNPVARELIPLGINLPILLVTEVAGYIHATSLRWALFYENRLEFNANLRLLTFSKKSYPNSALCNFIFFVCIALCYAASPMILMSNTYDYYQTDGKVTFDEVARYTSLSRAVPFCLGAAILTQCLLSAWCIWGSMIPTWSSDPLNTLAAAMTAGLARREGRCLMAVHDRKKPSTPTRPAARQRSASSANNMVIWVLVIVTLSLGALIIWTGIIIHIGYQVNNGGSWAFMPSTATTNANIGAVGSNNRNQTLTVFLSFFATEAENGPHIIHERTMPGVLFFNTLIQSFLTFGLHCAELQITLSRDEAVWRTLASPDGSVKNTVYNSVTQPLKSWPSATLLIFKPIIHWLYNSAVQVDYAQGTFMRVPHVTYLTALWMVFLAFVVAVSSHRPKGPLPATYGHLQTMADVVDDWSAKMYWGDKTEEPTLEGVRHAGTSKYKLPAVDMDVLYA